MKIVCIGGGPGGLYFAISMKLRNPEHEITVLEQNKPHDTFGWGIVFSDQTLENLQLNDPESAETIRKSFAYWDNIDVHIHGKVVRSGGHGFIGIGRLRLIGILKDILLNDISFDKDNIMASTTSFTWIISLVLFLEPFTISGFLFTI